MLQFEKQLIITGAEQRVRKDNTVYTLVHVLGENGATFACVYKGDINKVMSIKKMQTYFVLHPLYANFDSTNTKITLTRHGTATDLSKREGKHQY